MQQSNEKCEEKTQNRSQPSESLTWHGDLRATRFTLQGNYCLLSNPTAESQDIILQRESVCVRVCGGGTPSNQT